MLNLFSLSSYVQFLGAFNFANVYSPIQDKLFEHFLNVDKRFSDLFSGMSMQISSDIDSVNSMSPLNTIEGLSTSPAIDEMKESLTRLEVEEKETKKQTEKTIKEELTMKYSRPMFMSFGLYCTFELLAFGFMDMLGCQSINASFALYNVFMIVVSLYFAICETLNIYRGCKVWSVFKPTHWWMMIVSILAFLSFVSNAWIVEGIGSKINLPIGFVEWMCYLGILLPTFPFILTMIFTSIHYRRSVNLIKENVDIISNKFNEIHKKKNNYGQFVFSILKGRRILRTWNYFRLIRPVGHSSKITGEQLLPFLFQHQRFCKPHKQTHQADENKNQCHASRPLMIFLYPLTANLRL